jgi:hypothetical protein
MNFDMFRRVNAKLHLIALDSKDSDFDVIADLNCFFQFAR